MRIGGEYQQLLHISRLVALRRFQGRPWYISLSLITTISAIALLVGNRRGPFLRALSPIPIQSLAVLPLENLSGDAGWEYFADGMTAELITELAKISSADARPRF